MLSKHMNLKCILITTRAKFEQRLLQASCSPSATLPVALIDHRHRRMKLRNSEEIKGYRLVLLAPTAPLTPLVVVALGLTP
jgi:hypothetical protein